MPIFTLLLFCLFCFADDEDSLLTCATSGVSRIMGRISTYICCDDNVLGSVFRVVNNAKNRTSSRVRAAVSRWWFEVGRWEKAVDVFMGAVSMGAVVIVAGAVPAIYAGTWAPLPACMYAQTVGCTVADILLYQLKIYIVALAAAVPLALAVTERFFVGKKSRFSTSLYEDACLYNV